MNIASLEQFYFYQTTKYSYSEFKRKYNVIAKESLRILNNINMYSKEGVGFFKSIMDFLKKLLYNIMKALTFVINWIERFIKGRKIAKSILDIYHQDPLEKITMPKAFVEDDQLRNRMNQAGSFYTNDPIIKADVNDHTSMTLNEIKPEWLKAGLEGEYIKEIAGGDLIEYVRTNSEKLKEVLQSRYEQIETVFAIINPDEMVEVSLYDIGVDKIVGRYNKEFVDLMNSYITQVKMATHRCKTHTIVKETEKLKKIEELYNRYPEYEEGLGLYLNLSKMTLTYIQHLTAKMSEFSIAATKLWNNTEKCLNEAVDKYNKKYKINK